MSDPYRVHIAGLRDGKTDELVRRTVEAVRAAMPSEVIVTGELDSAMSDLIEAQPKRWHLTLAGDWENGWEAEVSSGAASISTNESGWFHEPGGYHTPAAAVRALTARLKESSHGA